MKLNGGQMMCESLIREGVDVIFGVPGGAILPLYQTLPEYPKLRHILVRHEQGATHAADGYFRATGRVGVAWATSGPGATNMVTGMACAMGDSVPMVCVSGQVARGAIGTDAFQETDVMGVSMPVVKHSYLVTRAADVPFVVREAFHVARTGRPGPVLIDFPKDVQTEVAEFSWPANREVEQAYQPAMEARLDDVKRAAQLIARAHRPVILAGHGVIISRAFKELRELAEKAQVPVITTLLGIGGIPSDHVLNLGMPGMHGVAWASMAINDADLLIAVGMRFDDRVTGRLSAFAPSARIVHIDIDPAEIGKNIRPTVSLVGDAKRVLTQLLPLVTPATHTDWLAHVNQLKRDHPLYVPDDGETLYPQQVITTLSKVTDGRAIVVTGVGQHQMWTAQLYNFKELGQLVTSGGQGTMGYEVPAAMGAAVGRPDKTVWSICGDGGFQMTMYELATIVENNIPVKFAIFNNNSLGMVRQWQDIFYKASYVATKYTANPDFVKLAEAFGMKALRVSRPQDVENAIRQANAHAGPVLVDFRISPTENVFPMIPAGQSLAELIEDPRLKQPQRVR
jgi:acetolactate synthase-1/2/3 large subunit